MGLFGPKPSSWWVRCDKDPRWNGEGRTDDVRIGRCPPEVEEHIRKRQLELGEDPPTLLEFGVCKD